MRVFIIALLAAISYAQTGTEIETTTTSIQTSLWSLESDIGIDNFEFATLGLCQDLDGNKFDGLMIQAEPSACAELCVGITACLGFSLYEPVLLCYLAFEDDSYPNNFEDEGFRLDDIGDGNSRYVSNTSDFGRAVYICYRRVFQH